MRRDHDLPVDPDVEVGSEPAADRGVLAAVALGGAFGSLARWWLGGSVPPGAGEVPWATLVENVSGSLLLGALMVLVVEGRVRWRLARPFLGVGVLGGWTTFSAYALEARELVVEDRAVAALGYVAGSVLAGLAAAFAGMVLARRALAGGPST